MTFATARIGVSGTVRSRGLQGQQPAAALVLSSEATGNVSVTGIIDSGQYLYAGGLMGCETGAVHNSYASGSVMTDASGSGATYAGGLIGLFGPTDLFDITPEISASYATGNVLMTSNSSNAGYEGGLVGWAESGTYISSSYATGPVSGNGGAVGGLVGFNDGSISTSSALQGGSGPDGENPSGGSLILPCLTGVTGGCGD